MPDSPEPTSYGLTKKFYKNASDIASKILEILDREEINPFHDIIQPVHHDIPDEFFKGPF